jgi:Glycosyl transferases group 1
VSPSYLEWGLSHAGRPARPTDGVFPLGFQPPVLADEERASRLAWLRSRGVDPSVTICCFVGLFESSYDLETILAAARHLYQAGDVGDVQFVLCGDGSKMTAVRRMAARLPNVILLDWVEPRTVAALTQISQIGLAAYAPHALQSLPNKLFEYLAGGLAIVSSLPGDAAALLACHGCGITYAAGDARGLASAIRSIKSTPGKAVTMRSHSKQLFDEQFHAERVYRQFAEHLVEITVQRRTTTRSASDNRDRVPSPASTAWVADVQPGGLLRQAS